MNLHMPKSINKINSMGIMIVAAAFHYLLSFWILLSFTQSDRDYKRY
jgi:hypothetical protein